MPKEKRGRPSSFSQEIADEICFRLGHSESLRSILRDEHMPSMSMVFRWLADDKYKNFREQYTFAREVGLESIADEIMEIADEDPEVTEIKDRNGNVVDIKIDSGYVAYQRNRIDARKWILSKQLAKKYGDRTVTELTGADGGAIQIDDAERAAKMQAILAAAAARKNKDGAGV